MRTLNELIQESKQRQVAQDMSHQTNPLNVRFREQALQRRDIGNLAVGNISAGLGFVADVNEMLSPEELNKAALARMLPEQYAFDEMLVDIQSVGQPEDKPFLTTEWFGELFGADIDSEAFMTGTMLPVEPTDLVTSTIAGVQGLKQLARTGRTTSRGRRAARQLKSYDDAIASYLDNDSIDNQIKIYQETGWFFDPVDRGWKINFTDVNTQVDFDTIERLWIEGKEIRIGDVIKHDQLFDMYPGARNLKLDIDVDPKMSLEDLTTGFFNRDEGRIGIRHAAGADYTDTIIHELNHYIQEIEGFGFGADPAFTNPTRYADSPRAVRNLDALIKVAEADITRVAGELNKLEATSPELIETARSFALEQTLAETRLRFLNTVKEEVELAGGDNARDVIHNAWMRSYLRTVGETNARFAQHRHLLDQRYVDLFDGTLEQMYEMIHPIYGTGDPADFQFTRSGMLQREGMGISEADLTRTPEFYPAGRQVEIIGDMQRARRNALSESTE